MKSIHTFSFVILLVWSALPARAERFRTDINPALLYWQAFGEWPSLAEDDHAHVHTNDWRSRAPDERFVRLMGRYEGSFKLIRRAAKARVPCDWGYDLTDGPAALLPSLAKAKSAAQTARLRAIWHLHRGDQAAAREDLLGAFVLGRNVAADGILISALVQIAIENITEGAIAENFFRFDPRTLQELIEGIDASPPRGRIAQALPMERFSFPGWLLRSLEDLKATSGSEAQAISRFRELLNSSFTDGGKANLDLAEAVIKASGGTIEGLRRYINELDPLYDELDRLLRLSYQEFVPQVKAFNEKVETHPNRFVGVFFPVVENCRYKEFAAEVNLAMLRAAIEYRRTGDDALRRVTDPVFKQPFAFRRFEFEGRDRGFELRSRYSSRGFEEALIFVENAGPSFQAFGKNVGKAVK